MLSDPKMASQFQTLHATQQCVRTCAQPTACVQKMPKCCRIKDSISYTWCRSFLEGESEFHFAKANLGRVKAAQCQRRNA